MRQAKVFRGQDPCMRVDGATKKTRSVSQTHYRSNDCAPARQEAGRKHVLELESGSDEDTHRDRSQGEFTGAGQNDSPAACWLPPVFQPGKHYTTANKPHGEAAEHAVKLDLHCRSKNAAYSTVEREQEVMDKSAMSQDQLAGENKQLHALVEKLRQKETRQRNELVMVKAELAGEKLKVQAMQRVLGGK